MDCTNATNDPNDLLLFKGMVSLAMFFVVIITHVLIYRLNKGIATFTSDPTMASRIDDLNKFISNMKWRRNVIGIGLIVAVATLKFSISGWVLFFLFGFLVSMLMYVSRYLKALKTSA